jgi:hypothetical protein
LCGPGLRHGRVRRQDTFPSQFLPERCRNRLDHHPCILVNRLGQLRPRNDRNHHRMCRTGFGEKSVLKLIFEALVRAAERRRGLRFSEFELR